MSGESYYAQPPIVAHDDWDDLRNKAEAAQAAADNEPSSGFDEADFTSVGVPLPIATFMVSMNPAVVLELLDAVIHSGEQAADLRTALAIARAALTAILEATVTDHDEVVKIASNTLTRIAKLMGEA